MERPTRQAQLHATYRTETEPFTNDRMRVNRLIDWNEHALIRRRRDPMYPRPPRMPTVTEDPRHQDHAIPAGTHSAQRSCAIRDSELLRQLLETGKAAWCVQN